MTAVLPYHGAMSNLPPPPPPPPPTSKGAIALPVPLQIVGILAVQTYAPRVWRALRLSTLLHAPPIAKLLKRKGERKGKAGGGDDDGAGVGVVAALAAQDEEDLVLGGVEDGDAVVLDEGGPVLEANLPQMREQMESLRSAVRSLSVAGLEVFARNADARRENVAQTLVRLAFVALALLSVLLLSALLLARMARQGFRRANVLQATSARLETIIATSLDAVIVTNRLGHILEFNGAAESIFGHKRADVVGHNIADMVIPEHLRGAHKAGMSRYLRTGQRKVVGAGRVRLEAQRANGEIFPVEF